MNERNPGYKLIKQKIQCVTCRRQHNCILPMNRPRSMRKEPSDSLVVYSENLKVGAEDKIIKNAVPLHAMEALGGRGGIAPTHSRPRH
jgi:hypothetical protein